MDTQSPPQPTSQPSIPNQPPLEEPSQQRKKNILLILAFVVILFSILSGVLYYFGTQNNNKSVIVQVTPVPTITERCFSESGNIQQSDKKGWCKYTLPLEYYTGYTILYPDTWKVRGAGAAGVNLLFNEGKDQEVFLQVTSTTLPLEQADKVTYGFESTPEPLIEPSEKVTMRKVETIGDKQVLHVITENNGSQIERYFLLYNGKDVTTAYIFQVRGGDASLQTDIQQMISSMQFKN